MCSCSILTNTFFLSSADKHILSLHWQKGGLLFIYLFICFFSGRFKKKLFFFIIYFSNTNINPIQNTELCHSHPHSHIYIITHLHYFLFNAYNTNTRPPFQSIHRQHTFSAFTSCKSIEKSKKPKRVINCTH